MTTILHLRGKTVGNLVGICGMRCCPCALIGGWLRHTVNKVRAAHMEVTSDRQVFPRRTVDRPQNMGPEPWQRGEYGPRGRSERKEAAKTFTLRCRTFVSRGNRSEIRIVGRPALV